MSNEISISDALERIMREYLNRVETQFSLPTDVFSQDLWDYIIDKRKSSMYAVQLKDASGGSLWYCKEGINATYIDIISKSADANIFDGLSANYAAEALSEMLLDEAISSSLIEGAHSTKLRIKELLKLKLAPATVDEQMIMNNYYALRYIIDNIQHSLDQKQIFAINNIISKDIFADIIAEQGYRIDKVIAPISQLEDTVNPPSEGVPIYMEALITFINTVDNIPPFIKAAIFHYYFLYVSPFRASNGCNARALSYMYYIKNGYGFFKLYSLSSIISENIGRYYKAIRDVQDNAGDLTYFINFMLEMM